MNEHIQNLLIQKQYDDDIKEEAILRVLFNGESAVDVAEAMEIHSVQTINLWVIAYRRKIHEGLITLPPMTEKQKQDLHALQQRTKNWSGQLKKQT